MTQSKNLNQFIRLTKLLHGTSNIELSNFMGVSLFELSDIINLKREVSDFEIKRFSEFYGLDYKTVSYFSEDIVKTNKLSKRFKKWSVGIILKTLTHYVEKQNESGN